METEEKKTDIPKIEDAGIDKEMLELMAEDSYLKSFSTPQQIGRVMINYEAETLRELREINTWISKIEETLTIIGADKINKFFQMTEENLKKEQKRQNFEVLSKKDHKKGSIS